MIVGIGIVKKATILHFMKVQVEMYFVHQDTFSSHYMGIFLKDFLFYINVITRTVLIQIIYFWEHRATI